MKKCEECGIGETEYKIEDGMDSYDVCMKCYVDWVIEMELEEMEW